jgi:hypothetical protein
VVSDSALHSVLPCVDPPTVPCIVGLTITTSDRNRAVGRLLTERHITHSSYGDSLLVEPARAGGVAVCFAAGAI